MTLERIYIRPLQGAATQQRLRAELVTSMGIEGDRYFGVVSRPSVNVTLIEAEEIEAFLGVFKLPVDLSVTGRNLVTRGVRLNRFVGKEFQVGMVRLKGVELAEPCLTLGEQLPKAVQRPDMAPAEVVRRFVRRAGLRAEVMFGGEIRVGDPVLEGF